MTLQKLKIPFGVIAVLLLLLGQGVLVILADDKQSKPATNSVVIHTFEPLAGEWEGTYETRSHDQPRRRQIVAVSVRTLDQGRSCKVEIRTIGRYEEVTATFRFRHALNATGDHILTTDDPAMSGAILDGLVTDAAYDITSGNWRAAFRSNSAGDTNVTEWRWTRVGENLTMSRQDVSNALEGPVHVGSDLILRPRSNKARTAYNALPRKTQTFDGVEFFIQTPINIIGVRGIFIRSNFSVRQLIVCRAGCMGPQSAYCALSLCAFMFSRVQKSSK